MKRVSLKLLLAVTCASISFEIGARAGKYDFGPFPIHNSPRPTFPTFGTIERNDPLIDNLLAPDAKIEKLAEGFQWAEGPVWVWRQHGLFFSDVPKNIVYRWNEDEGVTEYLHPSGYTGRASRGGEPGSNGLTLDPQGRLVLCEHGDRRVARLDKWIKNGPQTTLVEYYDWRRFNSPNDACYKSNGDLYFTDPPYGLEGGTNSPKKELFFSGVYRLSKGGKLTLLTKELTFPNGIAFSPDEKTLYVAVSDPNHAVWMAYPVKADGTLEKGRVFYDATQWVKSRKGLPDGMKVDHAGNLFATGPGGVLIFSPQGKYLGAINTDEPTANCGWGDDGSVLYITANNKLCRIRTKTKGGRL